MSISSSANSARLHFTATSGQTAFSVSFEFFDDADLDVYVNGTQKTITTDYTVSGGDGSTGTVTFNSGLVLNDAVTITRRIDIERVTDFSAGQAINRAALNTQLDTLTAIASDNKDRSERALRAPDDENAPTMTLPSLASRKGTVLGFNLTTGAVEAGPQISDVSTLSAISADIATLADIEDGTDATDAIQNVNAIRTDVTTVAGINTTHLSNVSSVATEIATVAGISSDVTAVAGDATDIGTVATNIASINTNATNITDIQNASTNAATATTKAAEAATSATNAATSETNAATSATNAATSASAAAASQTAAAASAASAASAFDNFDDTYLGSKTSDPTTDNDGDPLNAGDLYFNSTANEMRVYDGANWIAATSAGNVSLLNYNYTATSGQTTFSGADDNAATLSYTQQNLIVTLNGITLEDGTDYTANNGTSIVLASGAATGDELNIVAFKSFTTADMVPASTGGTFSGSVAVTGDLTVDTNTLYADSTNNRVGIGTISPTRELVVNGGSQSNIALQTSSSGSALTDGFQLQADGSHAYVWNYENTNILFATNNTERMRIDSSGNLLVGKTSTAIENVGLSILSTGRLLGTADSDDVLVLRRNTTDGDIISFRKDGTTVGSIGINGGYFYLSQSNTGILLDYGDSLAPSDGSGAIADNQKDVGHSANRWDDVYATNGTIQTSDQNEKQQIASLTDAEITAAKAISKLFKTFKWNDSVAEKGDAARTHTGVIAQEVEQAMTDAGLNAGDYAFFISSDWTDEETGEERNRKGIRYPQLMSFIGAATEQRLASIEARLDALEGN